MKDPKQKAEEYIDKLGVEGAKRQTLEEIGNSDSEKERNYYSEILTHLEQM